MHRPSKRLFLASLPIALSALVACGAPPSASETLGVGSAELQNAQGAYVATAEVLSRGAFRSGNFLDTQNADGVAEALDEQVGIYAGEPDPTSRELWHAYTLSGVPAGAYNLRVIARKSVADGEAFHFNWDGGTGGNAARGVCRLTANTFVTCDVTVLAGGADVTVSLDDNSFQDTTTTTLYVDYVGLTPSTDFTAPSVSFSSPAAGASVSGVVTLKTTTTDDSGVITRVEYFVGSTLLSRTTTAPYSAVWNTSSYPGGTHTLTAKAYDPSGNVGTTTVDVIVVPDTQAPTGTLTAPANGATVSDWVTLTASASDDVGVSWVEFFSGGEGVCADYSAPFTCVWDSESVANGSHPLSIRIYDAAGNVGTHAITVNVSNTVPPPPTTAVATVSASGRSGVNITSNPTGITVASGQTRSATFNVGTSIRLAVGGGRSAIFSGACSSNGSKASSCTFTLNANASVSANIQ
jgi:hypothetical protein